jgi:hypothetical protein
MKLLKKIWEIDSFTLALINTVVVIALFLFAEIYSNDEISRLGLFIYFSIFLVYYTIKMIKRKSKKQD